MKDNDLIELGVASVETKGLVSPTVEDAFGIPQFGLSDD